MCGRGSDFIAYVIAIVAILIVDQLSKHIIEQKMEPSEKKEVIKNKVYFTNVKNKGAALGMFQNSPKLLWGATFLTAIFVFYQFVKTLRTNSPKAIKLGLTFILGGGISNILDRAVKKQVTDFIYIPYKHIPIFNIADVFIFIGTIFVLVKTVFEE